MSTVDIAPHASRPETDGSVYRDLFERSGDAHLIIRDGTFVDCNAATVAMLRYGSRVELLQTHPSQLSPEFQPDGKPSFEKAEEMMAIARREGSHRFEWDHVRADGEVFPVEVLLTSLSDDDGALLHTTWRDVSDRRRLESELRHSQKLEAVGKLAGGVAHDFNNLLVAIIGNAEFLEMDLEPDSPLRELVAEIRTAGDRASELVTQLLAYSRKQVLVARVFDLNDEVRELSSMLRHLIGADVATSLEICEEPLTVKADGGRIEQVVMNLAANARDAMPEGGRMTIATDLATLDGVESPGLEPLAAGAYAVLRVADDGEGVAPENLPRIFDPFFTTRPGGNGLGLATAHGIVRQSGGDIVVESEPGAGTAVTVYLPLTDETAESVAAEAAAREPRPEGGVILLVEDEPSVASIARRVLEQAGYTVHAAEDGLKALDLIAEENLAVDLLFTDVIMPNLGGPELARLLHVRNPSLKVLFASGYTDDALTDRGVLQSGVELLQKPYTREDLLGRVRAVLDD